MFANSVIGISCGGAFAPSMKRYLWRATSVSRGINAGLGKSFRKRRPVPTLVIFLSYTEIQKYVDKRNLTIKLLENIVMEY